MNSSSLLLDQFDGAVVVAVAVVRVVQMAIHQIAGVVTVRNGFVAAAGAVHVVSRVAATDVAGSATVGILGGNLDGVVLDRTAFLLVMQVSVVQIVDVIAVLDGGVAAVFSVIVIVMIAVVVMSHDIQSSRGLFLGVSQRAVDEVLHVLIR